MNRKIAAALSLASVVMGCSDPSAATVSRDASVLGQEVELRVGQVLELTLFEGGAPYNEPEISDGALEFVSSATVASDLPGGPPRRFEFRGVREGSADVVITRRAPQEAFHFIAIVRR